MENRIPIDDLIRNTLNEGHEQLNLSAWANMERMLDGKNPYAAEKEKKRRILPFLLLSMLLGGGITASYWSSQHQTTLTAPQASNKQSIAATTSVSHKSKQEQTIPGSESINQTSPSSSELMHAANSRNHSTEKSTPVITSIAQTSEASSSKETKTAASEKQAHSVTQADNNNLSNAKQGIVTQERKKKHNENAITKNELAEDVSLSKSSLRQSQAQSTVTETKLMPTVLLTQKAEYKRNGTVTFTADTVSRSVLEQTTTHVQNIPVVVLDYHQTNPRYKELSAEEEVLANRSADVPTALASETTNSSKETSSRQSNQQLLSIVQKKKSKDHSSYFEDLKRFGSDEYQKLKNFVAYGFHPNTYMGMSAGINASLSNAQHNFGGFHAGITQLKPISDYASLLTEFKFFYRNNGGYTANDSYYSIINTSKDTLSVLHQNIYSYQKDSSVRTYNFKNFYSLELPIMMQFNYHSVAVYGGVNLAYAFKLNTTEKFKKYVVDVHDTMPSSIAYSFPADKGNEFVRSDFSSRFGLGYTLGASYSFSPQLYLDLRITQQVWDNMKTNSAREISNGFFKVPNVQFALAYRFRRFVPNN
ncbi:MAG: hypothetical protein RIQ62_133 [Bacteroidota bacterium]